MPALRQEAIIKTDVQIYCRCAQCNEFVNTTEERAHRCAKPIRDVWGADSRWTVTDWQYDVANGDTRLGYWEWVDHNEECEANEEE